VSKISGAFVVENESKYQQLLTPVTDLKFSCIFNFAKHTFALKN